MSTVVKAVKRIEPALLIQVLLLGFVFVSQGAFAQDITQAGSGVTNFLKSVAKLIFMDWGYYIAMIGAAICIIGGFTGRLEWKTVGIAGICIFLFFCIPNLITTARDSANVNF
jgi:type IV secretory pathway VirB2 component (pilin)